MDELLGVCAHTFCDGCIYDDGEDCLRVTPTEILYSQSGEVIFCAGLTY